MGFEKKIISLRLVFFFIFSLIILLVIYRDLRKNILEKLPPELFLNTRNITELYVW